ncbi:GGDEF domain-containing protein [Cognatilysobacter terrigena]|uniref:GGDEF domain-containing protein n=1 Tax=Cognatilysobacter terrigena TaxID=2488749 RepID=UPI0014151105|nr:GGDEF domain-containing protein [Lysobacter terrigena]
MFQTLPAIDARFRYRMRLWFCRAFIVQLLVIGALRLHLGHDEIALFDAAWAVCLFVVLGAIHLLPDNPRVGDALVLLNAAFASASMHLVGVIGVGWVFPTVIASFAISRTSLALGLSTIMLVNAFLFTRFDSVDIQVAFGLSGVLITVLAYVAAIHVQRLRGLLERLATRDPLTDSGNRRAMDEALRAALRSRQPSVLAVLDLDHFKKINDAYGHAVGDRVLRETAAAARLALGDAGELYRLGGEEFVILLRDTERDAAHARLLALTAAVRRDVRLREVQVTCSVGLAGKQAGDDQAAWLARADKAVYRAKALGRDRVVDIDDTPELDAASFCME